MQDPEDEASIEVAMPGRPGEGRFTDLPEDLAPEKRAFVLELRRHFITCGLSLRTFGARYSYDYSTTSRYLNAWRMPDRGFVENVLDAVDLKMGVPVTAQVRRHLLALHEHALQQVDHRRYEHQVLSDQLMAESLRAQAAERQEQLLAQELDEKKKAYKRMRERIRELEEARDEDQIRYGAELAELGVENARLQDELRVLREQIAALEGLYEQAQARRVEAEERCEQLEHALAADSTGHRNTDC